MRISINVTHYSWPTAAAGIPAALDRVVRAADRAGVDTVWVPDHLLQCDPDSTPEAEMLEGYTTLGFLAARSERVRLGSMVTAATYRPPALLAKAVTTLDVLSGGRAWLGIGAGYHRGEADAMGLALPPLAERFERLEDTLHLARQMWAGDDSAFSGVHHQLQRPIGSPKPVRRPPILVGGMGERRTLRLVARHADACNLFDVPDGGRTVRRKLDVLARHCADVGRPIQEIDKTLSIRLGADETPYEFARRCEGVAELGIEHVVVLIARPWTEDAVASVGTAVTALAAS